jgi:acylphosphatase
VISRRLLISGRVQGVFYRAWTEHNARALGLDGWVRNLPDGRVEVLAMGAEDAVARLVDRCWQGPPAAKVADIVAQDCEAEPVAGFHQRRED